MQTTSYIHRKTPFRIKKRRLQPFKTKQMNDNKPYIFFRDGKLFACELPEEPHCLDDAIDWRNYETNKRKAIANALPVSNLEDVIIDRRSNHGSNKERLMIMTGIKPYIYSDLKEGDLYPWPGTLEKLNWTTLGNKGICRMMDPHYKLILP